MRVEVTSVELIEYIVEYTMYVPVVNTAFVWKIVELRSDVRVVAELATEVEVTTLVTAEVTRFVDVTFFRFVIVEVTCVLFGR